MAQTLPSDAINVHVDQLHTVGKKSGTKLESEHSLVMNDPKKT